MVVWCHNVHNTNVTLLVLLRWCVLVACYASSLSFIMVAALDSVKDMKSFVARHKVAVVDFFATWCGPCMAVKGAYALLGRKYPNVGLAQVNVDEADELAAAHRVNSLPTFIVFVNGEVVQRVDLADLSKVENAIRKHAEKVTVVAVTTGAAKGNSSRDAKRERQEAPKDAKKKKKSQRKND